MRLLVGYDITDEAYINLKEGKYMDVYTEYFEINGIKVFDLENFDFYDVSIQDYIENQLDIIGCSIDFKNCSPEYDVSANAKGGLIFKNDLGSKHILGRKRECSLLFYNNRAAIENGTEWYMTYKHNAFTIVIELETLNFEINVFGFTVLKSGNFDSNYEDFIYSIPDFGYQREISDKLTDVLKSIVVTEDAVIYVNDILAICNSLKKIDFIIKNGIKYVVILFVVNYNNIVIPPSVDDIKVDKGNGAYGSSMVNPIKLVLPRVKLHKLVADLLKSMFNFNYSGALETEMGLLKSESKIDIEVYG